MYEVFLAHTNASQQLRQASTDKNDYYKMFKDVQNI